MPGPGCPPAPRLSAPGGQAGGHRRDRRKVDRTSAVRTLLGSTQVGCANAAWLRGRRAAAVLCCLRRSVHMTSSSAFELPFLRGVSTSSRNAVWPEAVCAHGAYGSTWSIRRASSAPLPRYLSGAKLSPWRSSRPRSGAADSFPRWPRSARPQGYGGGGVRNAAARAGGAGAQRRPTRLRHWPGTQDLATRLLSAGDEPSQRSSRCNTSPPLRSGFCFVTVVATSSCFILGGHSVPGLLLLVSVTDHRLPYMFFAGHGPGPARAVTLGGRRCGVSGLPTPASTTAEGPHRPRVLHDRRVHRPRQPARAVARLLLVELDSAVFLAGCVGVVQCCCWPAPISPAHRAARAAGSVLLWVSVMYAGSRDRRLDGFRSGFSSATSVAHGR
jgi:hypothetical protein